MLKISKSYSVLLFSDLLFLRFKIHQYYELLGLKTKVYPQSYALLMII